jgi:hypothetical protein
MPYPLNNVATENAYTPGTTLECPRGVRFTMSISNAAIFYQLGINPDVHKQNPQEVQQLVGASIGSIVGGIIYGPEIFCLPKDVFLSRICDSIRVRSGATGVPARVTISAWKAGEVQGI